MSRLTDEIVKELMLAPAKNVYTVSRDELIELMFDMTLYRMQGLWGAAADIHKREEFEKENPGVAPGETQ